MNKWEKEVQKSLLDSEEETLIELEKQYKRALNDIGNKIKAFQVDIDMLDAAIQSEGLDDKAKEVLKTQRRSKVYQKQFQEALKGQVSGILDQMQGNNYQTIESYLKQTYEDAYIGTMYDLHGQGIPVITPIDQAAAVKAVLTDSKISKGLYTALGLDVAKLKKSISAEVTRGIATSLSYADIARNLSNVSKAPLSRARTIVRTEGHRIQQASTMDAQQAAKAKGADVVKQWDAALDGRTRPTHRQLNGQIREVDEMFEVAGKKAMAPGYFGDPAEDCNCRCACLTRARWALDEDELEELKKRAEFFGLDKTKEFEDFKKRYLKAAEKTAETLEKSSQGSKIEPGNNPWNFDSIQGEHGIDDDVGMTGSPVCNPKYFTRQWGYTQNCQRCVPAYEFRRRGYDVIATERPKTNNRIVWGTECFVDENGNAVRFTLSQTVKQVQDELKNAPDGARYSIFVQWNSRSSHVFVAEKENGVVRYVDPQNGKTDASDYFQRGQSGRFGFFRMDDKVITSDMDMVKKTVESAKNG